MSNKERISEILTQIHQSAMELCDSYMAETKRQVYVTPVMFMDVIQSFGSLLDRKNDENETERNKYELGVQKLVEAEEMVKEMEAYLKDLQPELL